MMPYLIIVLFAILCILAFLEDRLPNKYHMGIYIFVGFCLILMAGFREIGADPDSDNYASAYRYYYQESSQEKIEFTYVIISAVMNIFTDDPHSLFLIYAILGVVLKFVAFKRGTDMYFLALVAYLSYYYVLHEQTQIRTGVLSGLFLLAIPYMAEKKRWHAFILFAIGFCFHYSAALFLPLLFLGNKPFTKKSGMIWACVIPAAYMFFFVGSGFLFSADLPLVGNKLQLYQNAAEKGLNYVQVNVFSPFQLLTIAVYYYLLFFSETITAKNKYFPLMMRFFAIGLAAFAVFAFLPVLAQRVSYLLRIVTILLFTNIYYTIRPRWAAIAIVEALCLLYLNYGLLYLEFPLFFKTGT